MIKVTTKNGVDLFISLCDDVEPNKGGYYCEVYLEDDDCLGIDNFVIHKEDLDCFEDREVGIETFCKVYAKHFDDMPYLNVEFNEIYEKMSDAYDLLNEFFGMKKTIKILKTFLLKLLNKTHHLDTFICTKKDKNAYCNCSTHFIVNYEIIFYPFRSFHPS